MLLTDMGQAIVRNRNAGQPQIFTTQYLGVVRMLGLDGGVNFLILGHEIVLLLGNLEA